MAVEKIDVESRLFDGIGRVLIFPNVDPYKFDKTTTLAQVLLGGKDCGKIIEGSGSWDGDDAEIEVLKSTEGEVIRSKDTPGTFAWSARVPHSKQMAAIAGGVTHAVTSLGDDFEIAEGEDVIGLNPEDMSKRCPVGILNLSRNELQLFPKGAVTFSPTKDDDDLQEFSIKAQAEGIKTKHLSTMMFIPLASDPLDAEDEEDDNTGGEQNP